MYINKVTLYGNLTKDIELKSLPSGVMVAQISMATNRTTKDESGAKKDYPEYHSVVSFGKQAETLAMYVKKGDPILVEGRLQTRSWDGQDGKKQYKTEIILESFQFGAKSKSTGIGSVNEEVEDDEELSPENIPF